MVEKLSYSTFIKMGEVGEVIHCMASSINHCYNYFAVLELEFGYVWVSREFELPYIKVEAITFGSVYSSFGLEWIQLFLC